MYRNTLLLAVSFSICGPACNSDFDDDIPRQKYPNTSGKMAYFAGDGTIWAVLFSQDLRFKTSKNAFSRSPVGDWDGLIVNLSGDLASTNYASYFGGKYYDYPEGGQGSEDGSAVVYGWTNSKKFPMAAGIPYLSNGTERISFLMKVDPLGRSVPWSTFWGGKNDTISRAVLGPGGELAICGWTEPPYQNIEYTVEPLSGGDLGSSDCFVAIFNPDGSLRASRIFGGSGAEYAKDIVFLSDGSLIVCGHTLSDDFPVTEGVYQTALIQPFAGFAMRLSGDLETVLWSTFIQGGAGDSLVSVQVYPGGEKVLLGGMTYSRLFPVSPDAVQSEFGGWRDLLFLTMHISGGAPEYATFLGGEGDEILSGKPIFIEDETVVLVGTTSSDDFPVTDGAFQKYLAGGTDAFIVLLDLKEKALAYGSFLGGSKNEELESIAVNGSRKAVLVGTTESTDFPVTPGAFDPSFWGNAWNAFVTVLDLDEERISASTYLNGKHKPRRSTNQH